MDRKMLSLLLHYQDGYNLQNMKKKKQRHKEITSIADGPRNDDLKKITDEKVLKRCP